ncbi:hypothetical protein CRG98_031416 [Punica granatum]|nr:hypothetical protein CRG98_031416 [Punica granatum]
MANVATIRVLPSAFLVFFLLFTSFFLASGAEEAESHGVFRRTLDQKLMGLKKEKLTHFRLYWQEVVSGKNPTSIRVIQPVNGSQVLLGLVQIFDNALTLGPDPDSKMVGRAQGFVIQPDQNEIALLKAENFVFVEGKYNGSAITILGRNSVANTVREMPIVGGSGLFRFARGYVQLRTHAFNNETLDTILEYNVYVLHY